MDTLRADLEPTLVAEWDAEDEVSGVLADDTPTRADEDTARTMLNELRINLPQVLDWTELVSYVRTKETLSGFHIPPDTVNFDYYAVEVPLTLIVPPDQQLVRLRLTLELTATGEGAAPIVAYDLFPTPQVDVKTILSGNASLDIAEGLHFALVASGVPEPLAGVSKFLGLKLNLPFQWTARYATIQSSARMSNPVVWSVTDDAIAGGLSASVIVRVPKGQAFTVAAALLGELRRKMLGVFHKTQFKTFAPQTYQVG
jgi:hypothetical protein